MSATQQNEYAMVIWKYVPPIIIAVGTLGHILTIIAVNGPNRRATSFSVYLTTLALVDTAVLYKEALNLWLQFSLGIFLKNEGQWMCKFNYFLGFLFTHMSSWIVMSLTIERTFCMFFPHKLGQLPGPRVGLIVVSSVFCFLCGLDAHVLYGRELVVTSQGNKCGFVDNNYKSFFYTYWNKIHFIVYFALPVTVIILGNSALVVKVYQSARSVTSTTSNMLQKRRRQVFLITLLISIAFVVLVSPLPLLFFIAPVDPRQLSATIFLNMLYLNHAINFFLYVLSGSRFRKDLIASFRRLLFKTEDTEIVPTISTGET